VKLDRFAVVVEAMLQDECASFGREFQGQSAEGHEQRAVVALVVGQAAAILVAAEGCGGHRTGLSFSILEIRRRFFSGRVGILGGGVPEWNGGCACG
jgi:hypothetical protein